VPGGKWAYFVNGYRSPYNLNSQVRDGEKGEKTIRYVYEPPPLVRAETEKREFEDGAIYIQYSRFDLQNRTQEELDKVKRCATCPGIDGYLPEIVTESIWLEISGNRITLPSSLSRDLLNPHVGPKYTKEAFSVSRDKDMIVLSLSGGDGSGSYKLSFKVDLQKMEVVRELRHFPDPETPLIREAKIGGSETFDSIDLEPVQP